MADVIRAVGLVKRFGTVTALDGLDLAVAEGSILALLGPNGAGKTTAVRILTTLLRPDAGTGTVAGYDVVRDAERLKADIGLTGQDTADDEKPRGPEKLEKSGRLYPLSA